MSLEENIKLVIENKLKDGTIEKAISDSIQKGIEESLNDLFSWSGDAKKVIEEKIKSVIVPYLESYDYSAYITKLDSVLTNILKETTKDNRKILSNFQKLMSVKSDKKIVKVSEVFDKWCDFVINNVETNGLEINYDDGVSYEPVGVSYEFERSEKKDWLSLENGRIIFECEQDTNMNICIEVCRWSDIDKESMWNIKNNSVDSIFDLKSLRYLDEFKLYLMSLEQGGIKIKLDEEYLDNEVIPEKEPESYFE